MSGPAKFLTGLFGLEGQTAVVIGGTGVLGGALATGLAEAGARIVVAGRDAGRGSQRVAAIEAIGGAAIFSPVDVTKRESIEALAAVVYEELGQVDILINGAGVNSASAYLDVQDEDWDWVLRSNLTAVHWGCQIFGRRMVESGQGGSILNIASITADRPLSKVFAYSASKAAVVSLTRNVAREFGPHGVRVNALCPGFFPAEQNRKLLDAERRAKILAQTPVARFGEPDELVAAALLLVSRQANKFLTGASLYVDGGFTAMRL